MRRRAAFSLLSALALAACIPPGGAMEKLLDSAHEVTNATRFGRLDIVEGHVKPDARLAFVESHAEWGQAIRILDVEYGGTKPITDDKAIVALNISWQRLDESTLRATSISQLWERTDNGWMITTESVAAGDKRLLRKPEAPNGPLSTGLASRDEAGAAR